MKARLQPQQIPKDPQLFLRIKHPSMDPHEITRVLAIEPTETITAGMTVSGGVRRMHSESYWIAQLPGESMRDLVKKHRAGILNFLTPPPGKGAALELIGATEWDVRILLRLKEFEIEAHQEFLRKIIQEGGSIALLVNRADDRSAFSIRRALPKLAQLGIGLEVD